ncbi:MAG: glucosamine-6-phosphate deaminase [Halioglobus sp.]
MEVIIVDSPEQVATRAARMVSELIQKKPGAVLGLATGSSPIAMYRILIAACKRGEISFGGVTSFNLDEYIGLPPQSPHSYRHFMQQQLFDHIDIPAQQTNLPTCYPGDNPREVGDAYEQRILRAGGIDLQILGIGGNGHIGFNEPSSSLVSRTRIKTLTHRTVEANSRLFQEGEFQPHLAMTMGIGTILDARHILLLATGENKAAAVRDAIEGPLCARCPGSALQLHRRAVLVLDRAAASDLEETDYYQWVESQHISLVEEYGHYYDLGSENQIQPGIAP